MYLENLLGVDNKGGTSMLHGSCFVLVCLFVFSTFYIFHLWSIKSSEHSWGLLPESPICLRLKKWIGLVILQHVNNYFFCVQCQWRVPKEICIQMASKARGFTERREKPSKSQESWITNFRECLKFVIFATKCYWCNVYIWQRSYEWTTDKE